MSSFLAPDSTRMVPLGADDIRLWSENLDQDGTIVWISVDDQFVLDGFKTGWWPGTGGMDATGGEWCASVWWDRRPEITRGHSSRLGFTGVVRDVYGTGVAGALVHLFRTSDDTLQDTRTSASDGTYTVSTPFNDAHYMVAFKDDVIDTAGATVNTLIPA